MKRKYQSASIQSQGQKRKSTNKKAQKRQRQKYTCGMQTCGKVYSSYTAFYNHCKNNHRGKVPQGSLFDGLPFLGPSQGRGRPKIRKSQIKDQIQIQSIKIENQLIEFLGSLSPKKEEQQQEQEEKQEKMKNNIVYVQNPQKSLKNSNNLVKQWDTSLQMTSYIEQLNNLNRILTKNDIPEFLDPIQIQDQQSKLDCYSFESICDFVMDQNNRQKYNIIDSEKPLLRKALICWLSRILSEKLLAQVIYTIFQINFKADKIIEKELFLNKSQEFNRIIDEFFKCFITDNIKQVSKKEDQKKQMIQKTLNLKHY